MIAIAIQRINNSWKLIQDANEYVLSVPGESLAKATLLCGLRSFKVRDKVAALGLDLCTSERVRVPGLKKAIANIELRKCSSIETGDHMLIVGEVLRFGVNTKSTERPLLSVGPDTRGYQVLQEKGIHRIAAVDRDNITDQGTRK